MTVSSSLLPPSYENFTDALTPNTRSEAEAALTLNSAAQTDSAAPDPTLSSPRSGTHDAADNGSATEAHKAYRRPGVVRTSSANYEMALKNSQRDSASSNMSTESDATTVGNITGERVASPTSSAVPFPAPGQGVVPLNYGSVGAAIGEPIKKTRSRGLSLSGLAQQQGWNEQDFRRVYSVEMMDEMAGAKDEAGYGSGQAK